MDIASTVADLLGAVLEVAWELVSCLLEGLAGL